MFILTRSTTNVPFCVRLANKMEMHENPSLLYLTGSSFNIVNRFICCTLKCIKLMFSRCYNSVTNTAQVYNEIPYSLVQVFLPFIV